MKQIIPIYTIGYGTRSLDNFIDLLKHNQIAFLIDVRSKPRSKFKPEFSKDPLEQRINLEGIKYVYMGDLLGGQPDLPSVYMEDGKIDYDKLKEKDFFLRGIHRLQDVWNQQLSVALMCSEGKPEMCHRSKLIGEMLTELGIEVMHIDEKGELVSQRDAMLRLTNGQMSFFDSEPTHYISRKSHKLERQEPKDE
jgi:uncharacterized protein (DUF488 family)